MNWGEFSPLCVVLLLVVTSSGCGRDSLKRQAIWGEVTLDGAPLPQGSIEFSPEEGTGVASGALIQNGKYSIAAAQGLPAGKYGVRVSSAAQEEEVALDEDGLPGARSAPPAELIPAEYSTQSEQVVTVTEAGPNKFDLHIKSK